MATEKTWNIFFIGIDITKTKEEEIDTNLGAIENAKNIFLNDLNATQSLKNINITYLDFIDTTNISKVTKISHYKGKELQSSTEDNYFNCHNYESYRDFFKLEIAKTNEQTNPKFLVIFVAHSFGGGFVPFNGDGSKYLSLPNFGKAIEEGFGDKKLDALIAINCTIQSVESNFILRKNVSLLIGSQKPLFVKSITFKYLLEDLENLKHLEDDFIFSKFCMDSFNYSKNKMLFEKIDSTCIDNYPKTHCTTIKDQFSISVTEPKNSLPLMQLLFEFSKISNSNNISDSINFTAANHSLDPSPSERIGFIDCTQFFLLLKSLYLSNAETILLIDSILNLIRELVVLNICDGNSLQQGNGDENMKYFLPYGVGLFIPKVKSSATTKELLDIFSKYFSEINQTETFIIDPKEWKNYIENKFKNLYTLDSLKNESTFKFSINKWGKNLGQQIKIKEF